MTSQKVLYPGPGCVVEFMQGNAPVLAFVIESQGGKLRLLTQNMRETSLPANRLLPWAGPMRGINLSRQSIATLLEEHKKVREKIRGSLDLIGLWETVQNEVDKTSSEWLASLLWSEPTIDHEAALGGALLECKTHFRFSPPDFEVYTKEKVGLRIQEAEAVRLREEIASVGTDFFRQLWTLHQKGNKEKSIALPSIPPHLEEKLKEVLFFRMADPDSSEEETLWKQLIKGLPEHPRMALCLATAWKIVPEHYNDLADKAHFSLGTDWLLPFSEDCQTLLARYQTLLTDSSLFLEKKEGLFKKTPRFITIDPASTFDKDDAFYLEKNESGGYTLFIALASPALCWPFESCLDKAVLRRATSLYLPEGDEHMLAPSIGWKLFSLKEKERRPVLLVVLDYDSLGTFQSVALHCGTLATSRNFALEETETAFQYLVATNSELANAAKKQEQDWENIFLTEESQDDDNQSAPCFQESNPAFPYLGMLNDSLFLARLLQNKRIANGAVITERPDPLITLFSPNGQTQVSIEDQPTFSLSHLVIGEFMIAANQQGAAWAHPCEIPLLYRTQDVAIPREFAGVWTKPHEISRVVKALPGASLEASPKRHAGLGLSAYTPYTSPIRRYTDLINQAQIISFLLYGKPRLTQKELEDILPLISSRSENVSQVQRMRPRYWKLLFFRQQGDKKWWSGVITEEAPAFVTVSLPWAQLFLRGKRALFSEKLTLGQSVQIRIGKVDPLCNEMHIIETQEE